jgi:hypothetical protein
MIAFIGFRISWLIVAGTRSSRGRALRHVLRLAQLQLEPLPLVVSIQ